MLNTQRELGLFIMVGLIFLLSACGGFEKQLTYNAANKAHDNGEFLKAIQLYEKLLEYDPQDKILPENYWIRYDLAVAHIDLGQVKKAELQVSYLRKAGQKQLADQVEELIERSSWLYAHKAKKAFEEQEWDAALRFYEAALNIDPENPALNYELGIVFIELGNFDRARVQMHRLQQINRNDLVEILEERHAQKRPKSRWK